MPSVQLTSPSVGLAFAVLGNWHPGGSFVSHASLLRHHGVTIACGHPVPVIHMRPPIDLGDSRHSIYPFVDANVIGWVEDLTDAERAKMATWLAEVSRKMVPFPLSRDWTDDWLRHYILIPPVEEIVDPQGGGGPFSFRFSCVGLVLACYSRIQIKILDTSNPHYPTMFLQALANVYGSQNILAPHNLDTVGLRGPEPWPVPLPGHLFHALCRPAHEIRSRPYLPRSSAEANFPSQPADPLTAVEHTEAQHRAYRRASNRCGGQEPYGTEAQAREDFEWAAGEVIRERPS